MIDEEFDMDNRFYWHNAGLTWRDFERIKYLEALLGAIKKELGKLEEDPVGNKELINQEKTILEVLQKEIRKLERKTFYAQLGE
jgi:archaellum component FlaC